MSLGKLNSKRQNFVRKQLQFLKSERGRHNPKGDFAAHVLLTLHSLILCLIFFRSLSHYKCCRLKLSPVLLSLYLDLASDHGCAKSP